MFLGSGAVLSAASLSSLGSLPAQPGFVDCRGTGSAFRGVLAAPASLISFDASFNATSTETLPVLGVAGVGYPTFGEFGFVSASGAARWVVISAATPGGRRFGLISLP